MHHHTTVAAINDIFGRVATRYSAEYRTAEIAFGQSPTRATYRAMRRAGRAKDRAWDRLAWAKNVEAAS